MAHIHPSDTELDFLRECTAEELEPIVGAILGTTGEGDDKAIDTSGRLSSELDSTESFKRHYPNHTKYVDEIIAEIQTYGGNAIANSIRGYGVPYREVLVDVAKKLKVNFAKTAKTTHIETCLLNKLIEDSFEKLSDDQKVALAEAVGGANVPAGGLTSAALIFLVRQGGFRSYQIMLILVNALAKVILGHGLWWTTNIALCRAMAFLSGPVGWLLTGGWTVIDLLGPAYRVTIPAVLYISMLRKVKEGQKAGYTV